MEQNYFTKDTQQIVASNRILYTASDFARSSLLHLQETGELTAIAPHTSKRCGLLSYLFISVENGSGSLTYDGKEYEMRAGDCAFVDCHHPYSHSTDESLWTLRWCHFYGPNMNAIYRKYQERGGRPVFRTRQLPAYRTILDELYHVAGSDDYVRDMRIHEKLSSLLILLMEDAWVEKRHEGDLPSTTASAVDIQAVKEYLDRSFLQKITLDDLSSAFFINKYYLLSLFKDRYGVTINAYLNQVRVTYVKQQLRFSEKTVEMISAELGIEATYLSRLFKKVEGISPSEYRKSWKGKS